MKRALLSLSLVIILLGISVSVKADLSVIGTGTLGSEVYKLIHDSRTSLVWLDYSPISEAYLGTWSYRMNWAQSTLTNNMILNIDSGFQVNWSDNSWNLPSIDQISDLYYSSLGGTYWDQKVYYPNQQFNEFKKDYYWTSAEYDDTTQAWAFSINYGRSYYYNKSSSFASLAVRSAQVSAVPIPAAAWLLSSGLIGLVVIRRKFRK